MQIAGRELLLPTTMVGNYPNPIWYSDQPWAVFPDAAGALPLRARPGLPAAPDIVSKAREAFYDAVAENESAREIQGDEILAEIARELVGVMRRDIKTDWTVRDDVRAKLRSSIKRLLVKYKYPPDKQADAIRLVMDQMESMAPSFTGE